jgi:hypothetical protein
VVSAAVIEDGLEDVDEDIMITTPKRNGGQEVDIRRIRLYMFLKYRRKRRDVQNHCPSGRRRRILQAHVFSLK